MFKEKVFVILFLFGCAFGCATKSYAQLAEFSLEVTNSSGEPIDTIGLNESFMLRGYVQDLRDGGDGVFSAYMDVTYDQKMADVSGSLLYGEIYENGRSKESNVLLNPGILDEIGAFSGEFILDTNRYMLFEIGMNAVSSGRLDFFIDGPDLLPQHDILLYGIDTAVSFDEIAMAGASLHVVPEPNAAILLILGILSLARICKRRRR